MFKYNFRRYCKRYKAAAESDLPFIINTYNENISSLHGVQRSDDVWEKLLSDINSQYYVVCSALPVAWFRIDYTDNAIWLGMIQVKTEYHRKGIGKYILSVVEDIAKKEGFMRIGIHTTKDNIIAQALYKNAAYSMTEVGSCITADGHEREGCTSQKVI